VSSYACVVAHRVEFGLDLDERVLCVPRLPDGARPCAGSLLVVVEIVCPDHVKHGEWPRALGTREDGEVDLVTLNNVAEQSCCVGEGQVVFEHRAETDQVNEHRLAVSPVAAVSGVLCHIGVDHHSVRWRIPEAVRLMGLNLAKRLSALRA
jgi:hypothetical protein